MADAPIQWIPHTIEFPEIFNVLNSLGLARSNPQFRSLGHLGAVRALTQTKLTYADLPSPFPSIPPRVGNLFLSENPDTTEKHAEQKLADTISTLTRLDLSKSQRIRSYALLYSLKSLSLLGLFCTTVTLRHLSQAQGSVRAPFTKQNEVRGGLIRYTEFVQVNCDLVSRARQSSQQAYALQHMLSPLVASALRAGLVSTHVLLAPDGLPRVRKKDPSIVAFANVDQLFQALKTGSTACVVSYRHVMNDDGNTGLCERQLQSVRSDIECYDYVWLDTVYSRASGRNWAPACVTMFGVLDCFRTVDALQQLHRTWIRAESILSAAHREFFTNHSKGLVYQAMFRYVQMNAAMKIAGGALAETESTFASDRDELIKWAISAYTFPSIVLTGDLKLYTGYLSSMAAENHFDWSVCKSPLGEKMQIDVNHLLSPEQLIVSSINVKSLQCIHTDFVLRLLMRMQMQGHCFYNAADRRLYILFGSVGNLATRLFVYEETRVVEKKQWMLVEGANRATEYGLNEEEMVLIATAMAMNSNNRFEKKYLEAEAGRRDDVIINGIISAHSYEYVSQSIDVSGLMYREQSPYPFELCRQFATQLVVSIGTNSIEYRKLGTIYFAFCDTVSWD